MRDGPARGGTRGGKDQFSWESVKGDKDREYYLGHSVKASVGRWQKGKDLLWYTRGSGDGPGGPADEIAAVKAAEERAMAEALGLAPPPSAPSARPRLTQRELDDLLRRGRADAEADEATRVRGLGSARTPPRRSAPPRARSWPASESPRRASARSAREMEAAAVTSPGRARATIATRVAS